MGGIVSSHQNIRHYDQDILVKYQHMLPEYFTSTLTQSDLISCRQHWQTITMDTIPGFQFNESVKIYYDSCKTWLHSLLYHELMITSGLASRLPDQRHNFINYMKAMVVIALKQEKDNHETHDNEIKLLCKKIQNLGYEYDTFVSFGSAFITSLQVVTGKEWNLHLQHSWTNILSYIIFVCLSSFPVKELRHIVTTDGEEQSIMVSTSSRLAVGLHNERSAIYDRMYTSQYNSVIF